MDEQRWRPNVTVAAIVESRGRFLLVEEQTPDGLRLNNPAGHLDPGESLLQAVMRETLEETGCRFEPRALVGVYRARRQRSDPALDITYLRFAFRGSVGPPDPAHRLDAGIVRTVWMTPEEVRESAPRHRSPLVLCCVEDHLRGASFPLALLRDWHP